MTSDSINDRIDLFGRMRVVLLLEEAHRLWQQKRAQVAVDDVRVHEAELLEIRYRIEEAEAWNLASVIIITSGSFPFATGVFSLCLPVFG